MEPERKPPILFANRIIRMMVDHTGGEEMIVLPHDYTVMRVIFRKLKGSWELLSQGDIKQAKRLRAIVSAWSKMPGRKKQTEFT